MTRSYCETCGAPLVATGVYRTTEEERRRGGVTRQDPMSRPRCRVCPLVAMRSEDIAIAGRSMATKQDVVDEAGRWRKHLTNQEGPADAANRWCAEGADLSQEPTTCDRCDGSGWYYESGRCVRCDGRGWIARDPSRETTLVPSSADMVLERASVYHGDLRRRRALSVHVTGLVGGEAGIMRTECPLVPHLPRGRRFDDEERAA